MPQVANDAAQRRDWFTFTLKKKFATTRITTGTFYELHSVAKRVTQII
jgi:hypothetical protein